VHAFKRKVINISDEELAEFRSLAALMLAYDDGEILRDSQNRHGARSER
jgi:hypothetical protein